MDNPATHEVKLTNAQGVSIGLGKPPKRSISPPDANVIYFEVDCLATLLSDEIRSLVHSVIPVSGPG